MAIFKRSLKYKRAIALYSIAILVPGVFLSIMAYRGIQGSNAVIEKKQSERLISLGQKIFQSIEGSIFDELDELSKNELNTKSGFIELQTNDDAQDFFSNDGFVTLIQCKSDRTISLLRNTLLFVPERHWEGLHQNDSSVSLLSQCNYEEFDNRNIHKALLYYRQLEKVSSNVFVQAESILGQARIYGQLNQISELRKCYRDLFELIKDPAFEPYVKHVARDLMADILTSWFVSNQFASDVEDQSLKAMEAVAFLAIPQCYLKRSYYLICSNRCQGTINQLLLDSTDSLVDVNIIDTLYQNRESEISRSSGAIKLMDQIYSVLKQDESTYGEISEYSFAYDLPDHSFYAAFMDNRKGERYALVIDMQKFLPSFFNDFSQKRAIDGRINLQVLDRRGNLLVENSPYRSKKKEYSESPINLGNWRLQMQYENPRWRINTFDPSRGMYVAGFIFVLLGLISGLIFTLRGLAQENKLTRLKSNFISSVSHELKSPITSIRQMSELLSRDRIQSEDRKKEYYSTMLAQSERMSHLIENILDFSRLEFGPKQLKPEPTKMEELLLEVIETFEIRLRYTGFKVHIDFHNEIPMLLIDREGIQHVFYNLLDNAYKYSGKSKDIDISLFRKDTDVGVAVTDYGIGIHTKDQKRIYNRYYRSSTKENSGIKGSGIGLAIVHQIVRAHYGRIELQSRINEGSRFTVFFPISKLKHDEEDSNY